MTSTSAPSPFLPKGSLILVTGASGHIGSNVVYEALQAGYKVRGTARSEEKADKTKDIFKHEGYSTAIVTDFQHDGAFDEAVKDVDAVIHVASDTTFGSDVSKVIKPTVKGVLNLAQAAAKTSSVKRFVLTSSSTAALLPHPGQKIKITTDSWNDETIDIAYNKPDAENHAFAVYGASKTEGEKALWKFVKDEKPGFVVNTVLPNFNMGRILDHNARGASGGGLIKLYEGTLLKSQPQYMIDVIDDARLHVIAAALDPKVENERIFAFNVPFNNTSLLEIMHQLYPDHKLPEPPKDEGEDLSEIPNEFGAELLQKWYGQDGYKPIEQSIKENLEGIAS